MGFDPDRFLTRYADAYNGRDPEKLRTFFALDDPRFAVFEDFSEDLFDGETYAAILEGAFDASGEMSFELLRCDRFDDFAIIHAIQKIIDEGEGGKACSRRSWSGPRCGLPSGGRRPVSSRPTFPPCRPPPPTNLSRPSVRDRARP